MSKELRNKLRIIEDRLHILEEQIRYGDCVLKALSDVKEGSMVICEIEEITYRLPKDVLQDAVAKTKKYDEVEYEQFYRKVSDLLGTVEGDQ